MKRLVIIIGVILILGTSSYAMDTSIYPIYPKNHAFRQKMQPLKLTIKEGEKITDFEVIDLGGNTIKTADIRENKILIIRFTQFRMMNAEKPPENIDDITQEFPGFFKLSQTKLLNDVTEDFPGKVIVLEIITKDETPNDKIIERYNEMRTQFTVTTDSDGKAAAIFGVDSIPTVLVFDKAGKLYAAGKMIMLYKDLKDCITDILNQEQKE